MNAISRYFVVGMALIAFASTTWGDELGSLKNMERERSRLIDAALDVNITPLERQAEIQRLGFAMVDLERMVLRDDRLIGMLNPAVRRAFNNYDLTFISHASKEANRHIIDFWLMQQGLTTESVLGARVGLR